MENYNKLLEKAQKAYKNCETGAEKRRLESIFPELQESEDKRIRKEIIEFLQLPHQKFVGERNQEEWIEWLQKQGEQNLTTKFKVGDWVVFNNQHSAYQIERFENYQYFLKHFLGGSMALGFCNEDRIKLWTIKDAKNGDVLVADDNKPFIFKGLLDPNHPNCPVAYCGLDSEDYLIISHNNIWWTDECVKPATMEQRTFLFSKIKEAGYEWDVEKKELKKIEHNVQLTKFEEEVEYLLNIYRDSVGDNNVTTEEVKRYATYLLSLIHQKPTWSEEDELRFKQAIYVCHRNKYTDVENWLRSFIERFKKAMKKE